VHIVTNELKLFYVIGQLTTIHESCAWLHWYMWKLPARH